jgi:hypothetical protein
MSLQKSYRCRYVRKRHAGRYSTTILTLQSEWYFPVKNSRHPRRQATIAHDPMEFANMDISESSDLYLLIRNNAPLWLAKDSNDLAIVLNPQPTLFRAAYSPSTLEQNISAAKTSLAGDRCWLLALAPCPDGAPHRWAFLFILQREVSLNFQDGPYTRLGKTALWYRRATNVVSLGSDYEGHGFFLTGAAGGSLWRLSRQELDAFNRWVLTLSPVRLSSQCPQADFSSLKSPILAQEVAAQYEDMVRAITTNSYREVVTKAKNIVEAIIAERLGKSEKSSDLFDNLKTIKRLLEDQQQRDSSGWTDLEYHLANKIRLVHGQTHATAPVRSGRPLRPEFALSTVEDLIDLLYSWGYCKS